MNWIELKLRKFFNLSLFERLRLIFTKDISHDVTSFRYILLTLKLCSSAASNWDKSNDVIFELHSVVFLPYVQLDEWLQSRSQDITLPYFNFCGTIIVRLKRARCCRGRVGCFYQTCGQNGLWGKLWMVNLISLVVTLTVEALLHKYEATPSGP